MLQPPRDIAESVADVWCFHANAAPTESQKDLLAVAIATVIEMERKATLHPTPRRLAAYHEDMGDMLWWRFPIVEPPYVGTPNDTDWPGYHTHFTPIPMPEQPGD